MIDFDTHPTDNDPIALINNIDHVRRKHDSKTLLNMMKKVTGSDAIVWGTESIGFGQYAYIYKTGRKGNWPLISFTPSLQNISIHVMPGFDNYTSLLEKIGHIKFSGNTLTLHKFSDINLPALEALLKKAVYDIRKSHESC